MPVEHVVQGRVHEPSVPDDEPPGHHRVTGGVGAAAQQRLDRVGQRPGVLRRPRAATPPGRRPNRPTADRPRRRGPGRWRRHGWPSRARRGPAWPRVRAASRPSRSALRDSIQSDAESVDDEPSHPMPTGTPAARNSCTGARPAPIIWLELGQWATPVPQRGHLLDLLLVRVHAVRHPRPVRSPSRRPRSTRAAGIRRSRRSTCPRRGPRPGGCAGGRPAARPARRSSRMSSGRHRERRARRQRHLDHGVAVALVVQRRPAARSRPGSRPASCTTLSGGSPPSFCERLMEPRVGVEPHAELGGGLDLGRDQVTAAGGVHVQVVHGRGAPTECQFREPDPGRQVRRLLVELGPDGVERGEPAEQVGGGGGRERTGEVLVDVVVAVDQAGRHQAPGRRPPPRRPQAPSPVPRGRPPPRRPPPPSPPGSHAGRRPW